MKNFSANQFHELRNKIFRSLVINDLIQDNDKNFEKIDFILAQILPIDWEAEETNFADYFATIQQDEQRYLNNKK